MILQWTFWLFSVSWHRFCIKFWTAILLRVQRRWWAVFRIQDLCSAAGGLFWSVCLWHIPTESMCGEPAAFSGISLRGRYFHSYLAPPFRWSRSVGDFFHILCWDIKGPAAQVSADTPPVLIGLGHQDVTLIGPDGHQPTIPGCVVKVILHQHERHGWRLRSSVSVWTQCWHLGTWK